MARQESNSFDYVIVGAGSAGCVLANRLSADSRHTVALLEAGGRDRWIWFHVPAGYLFAIGNPRADWMFRTEPDPGLNGRSLAYPRGKVIGGSSAINAMIYMRGQAADYDHWRQMGLTGWSWKDVLPYFRKQEDHFAGKSEFHGAGGEWHVDVPRLRWDLLDAFAEAAGESGIPSRLSAARAFLKPALGRRNLTLFTGTLAEQILFEDRKATGVRVRAHGAESIITARREVILSAGAVATPALLERSGIGRGEHLQALGIPVVHHLPGVGENLQDHLQLRCVFKVRGVRTMNVDYRSFVKRAGMALHYALARRGALTMAPSQLGAFTRSSAQYETPNLQFHIQPLSLDKFGDPLHAFPAFTASVANLRPTSRGSIHARSADAADPPVIMTNYLSTPEDQQVAIDAIRLTRRIVAAPALRNYGPIEHRPGAELTSDGDLIHAAGEIGTTIFHPVGTAKMGTDNDPYAVTDARLRVRGVAGLRVVDASVMPTITSGNTAAPTMMIAERAADLILAQSARLIEFND